MDLEDVLLVLGILLVLAGVALVASPGWACIAAGVAFVAVAFARSRRQAADGSGRRRGDA